MRAARPPTTVKLQTQPTTTVTVTVSSGDTGAATVSGPTLRFTPSNWDTEQTVTVEGVDDGDSAGEIVTITHTASGGEYAGVTASVTVTVDDDDTRGITFTPAARTIREGATGTYDVKLNTAPTADVTVAISSDNADVTVNKSSLTFTTVNYAHEPAGHRHRRPGRRRSGRHGESDAPPQRRRLQRRRSKDFMVTVTDDDTAAWCSRPRRWGWMRLARRLHREAADPAHHHCHRDRQLGRHGRGHGHGERLHAHLHRVELGDGADGHRRGRR